MTIYEVLAVGAFLATWAIETAILKLNPKWLCNAGIPAFVLTRKIWHTSARSPSASLVKQHLPEPISGDVELQDVGDQEIAVIDTVGYASYWPMMNAGLTFSPAKGTARTTAYLRPQVVVVALIALAWHIWVGPNFPIIAALLLLFVVMCCLQIRLLSSVLDAAMRAWIS